MFSMTIHTSMKNRYHSLWSLESIERPTRRRCKPEHWHQTLHTFFISNTADNCTQTQSQPGERNATTQLKKCCVAGTARVAGSKLACRKRPLDKLSPAPSPQKKNELSNELLVDVVLYWSFHMCCLWAKSPKNMLLESIPEKVRHLFAVTVFATGGPSETGPRSKAFEQRVPCN